ncbi:MAG: hypothetical protein KF683_00640 [Rubrivivax sp.]|nr:hypothetical protein [Rubrivivax sp.]
MLEPPGRAGSVETTSALAGALPPASALRFALDGFGCQLYSTLTSTWKRPPVDDAEIDRSFGHHGNQRRARTAIVRGVIRQRAWLHRGCERQRPAQA